MSSLLRPYVPRLTIDWLRDTPDAVHRQVPGSLVFADISGFTTLTERLALRGKVGAEEMGDLLNATFAQLLAPAYDYGAALLKWGGDAVLLLFDGDEHAARAARAAMEMQQTIRQAGRLATSAGAIVLRMSVGVHTGNLDFFLVGSTHRELVVAGTAASVTAQMEQVARAGEVVVSAACRAALGTASVGAARGEGVILTAAPPAPMAPRRAAGPHSLPPLDVAVPATVREHVRSGLADSEHRPVATGFVQFQGVDRLLVEDGAEAAARAVAEVLDAVGRAAEQHGVTFLTTDIAPDGGKVVLVAGAPRSLDRSEERMLCALRSVLDTPTRLPLRAGATSGRVFTGDFGPSYRRTYSVVGDSVNLAARLMAKAAPGQLITTPAVVERTRTRFECVALPPFVVKGKSAPIDALAVGAVVAPDDTPVEDAPWPFTGRTAEMTTMLAAVHRAQAGTGTVVEIVADAGLGKTRLMSELRAAIDGVEVLTVGCDAYDVHTPYAVWRRLLRDALGVRDEPDDVVAATLTSTVEVRCRQLTPWLPLLGAALGLSLPTTAEVEQTAPEFRSARLAQTVTDLLTVLLDRTTAVLVDDAHLMDDASAELLRAVERVVAERPWALLIARQPLAHGYAASAADHVVPVWLTPLDDDSIAALLDAATESEPLLAHQAAAVRERAAGNPLFLRELLAAVRTAEDGELPETLEAAVAAQIDQLPAESRRLLLTASVLGTTVDETLLAAMLGTAGAVRLDWTHLRPFLARAGRGRLRFRQSLVRDTAYQTLPFRRRLALHGAAGDRLRAAPVGEHEPSMLSFHFFNAARYDDAVDFSRRAGEEAAASFANVEAAECFQRALDSATRARRPAAERREIAQSLGDTWYRLGDCAKAASAYDEALRCARGDALATATIHLLTAKVRVRTGRFTAALQRLSRGLREARQVDSAESTRIAARLCVWQAYVRHEQGHQRVAVRWAEEAVALAEAVGDLDAVAGAYHKLDRASVALGRFEHEDKALRALEIWEELGDLPMQAVALNHLGVRSYFTGEWVRSLEHYERARVLFERIGDQWNLAVATFNIAEIYLDQRRYEQADVMLRRALRLFRALGSQGAAAQVSALLGRAVVGLGRPSEGRELLEAARDDLLTTGTPDAVMVAEARVLEAMVLEGHAAEALGRVEEALRDLRPETQGAAPLLHRVRAAALVGSGQLPDAVGALRNALTAARRADARHETAVTLDELVELSRRVGEPVAASLVEERDTLVRRLGLAPVTAAPAHARIPRSRTTVTPEIV